MNDINERIASLATRHPSDQPLLWLDGRDLKVLIEAAYVWMEAHRVEINELNVFPVPDGDTGTNMALTLRKAWQEIGKEDDKHFGELARCVARGATMGARGNSGVILSQIMRGFAGVLSRQARVDAELLVQALREGANTAYIGVSKPVEGTILTVCREAAEAAERAVAVDTDIRFVLEHTLRAAETSLQRTPELLPALKKAGVVDAGGKGLVVLLEGMLRALRGLDLAPAVQREDVATTDLSQVGEEWGYDVQYLIYNSQVDEAEIGRQLAALGGESIVISAAEDVIKVHVHGEDPGPLLAYGASLGHLDDIVVENMTLQTLRRKGEWPEGAASSKARAANDSPPAGFWPNGVDSRVGLIAVASGDGLEEAFRSLGVHLIVSGGQTMNPSVEDLYSAANSLPHDEVIFLPNNKNIILACNHAAELLNGKRSQVVPSRNIPQGIGALIAFDSAADLETNFQSMVEALEGVQTGEVTEAVREASIDGLEVYLGDIIGLVNGELRVSGAAANDVALEVLERLYSNDYDLLTIYYGQPVATADAEALRVQVEGRYPELEIDLVNGGQPHYHYILSVE